VGSQKSHSAEYGLAAYSALRDLSRLGEELATRIELEDRLIAAIRTPATV